MVKATYRSTEAGGFSAFFQILSIETEDISLKRICYLLSVILLLFIIVFALSSCEIGFLGGSSDNGAGEDGRDDGSDVQDPEDLSGLEIISVSIDGGNKITVMLTGQKTVEIGKIGYKDKGTVSVEYNEKLKEALGITGFEVLGADGLTVIVGQRRIDAVGKIVCSHSYSEWKLSGENCTEEKYSRACTLCGASDEKTEARSGEYAGHNIVDHTAKAPDCKSIGWEAYVSCTECDYTTYKELALTDHTPEILEGREPTETEYGYTEGSRCSVCLTVIVPQHKLLPTGYGNLDNYSGSYGYEYLGTMANGAALQSFYNSIDETAELFHTSTEDLGDDTVAELEFGEIGLTSGEALAVYSTYKNDNPLYYWLSTRVQYTSSTLHILTDEEYRLGSVRAELNDQIYNAVKEYTGLAEGYGTVYDLTLILHDGIIDTTEYSYEADGVTPSNEASAHNILGALIYGKGVCESYARTFQLILNYSGIDNIFVSGDSRNEAHAWNLVKLDDGNYYWYDLTWDDTPKYMQGISYNYFAVSDNAPLNRYDYGWSAAEEMTFLSTHIPTESGSITGAEEGLSFLYGLPERAEQSIPLTSLRVSFEDNRITYVRIGASSVIASRLPAGDVTLPETVSFGGRTYYVTGIGSVDSEGLLGRESVSSGITTLHIPKTVSFISDLALSNNSLTEITVDENNPYFTSLDGVLYTKNLITLVKYPEAKAGAVFEVPESVMYIAHGSLFYLENVNRIEIGINVKIIGYTYFGYPFTDTADGAAENYVDENEMQNIKLTIGTVEIIIDENNPNIR